jgi:hypothetical protein
MGGHTNGVADTAGPGICDIEKVKAQYCPSPSPTPTPNNEADCTASGNFWNFVSGGCFPTPQIEADCQNYSWYWISLMVTVKTHRGALRILRFVSLLLTGAVGPVVAS